MDYGAISIILAAGGRSSWTSLFVQVVSTYESKDISRRLVCSLWYLIQAEGINQGIQYADSRQRLPQRGQKEGHDAFTLQISRHHNTVL